MRAVHDSRSTSSTARAGSGRAQPRRHRVVVVGGGFAGLQAVRKLARSQVDVTLIDRRNFHLFQPLVYQVATGSLSPAEIASPLRRLLKRQSNARVLLAEVTGFDLKHRRVLTIDLATDEPDAVDYDTLIVSGGSEYSYFGHDEWEPLAPSPKTLEDAVEIRRRLLSAFEAAESERDEQQRRRWLTFIVVGGGPTGVEIAGQIAEMAKRTLRREFRTIDPREAKVLLLEACDRVLPSFSPHLSARAADALERLNVSVLVNHQAVAIDEECVTVQDAHGALHSVPAGPVVWAAGVRASQLGRLLAEAAGGQLDWAGRLKVDPGLTVPGHPDVFALGDMITVLQRDEDALALPGVAAVALQQGRYAAKVVRQRLRGRQSRGFRYHDKGSLATIGRAQAVAQLPGLELSGFPAWLIWLFVHLFYLTGIQNRVVVFTRWTASFLTNSRSSRIITIGVADHAAEPPHVRPEEA